MSLFGKLFGKKQPSARPAATGVNATSSHEELIRVHDEYGREFQITKEEWRDKVLLGNLGNSRNNPNQLYSLLVGALNDGFAQDVVPYAEHLAKSDPTPLRGIALLGVVYLQANRIEDAERVFQAGIRDHGEDGILLTNLAKVYDRRGESAKAMATLWHALELDPNQENGLLWYQAHERERGGDVAATQAFRRVAALPGSWRARLWLAREALENGRNDEALELVEEALTISPRPVPAELLMQVSGDLGQHGLLVELLKLTLPHFQPVLHGLSVGNNLIKANLDLGRIEHAHAILEQLYALKRPDFQEMLAFWDQEIAKARIAAGGTPVTQPRFGMLAIVGPVWLPQESPVARLFPSKPPDPVVVCCLGSSAHSEPDGNESPRAQLSYTRGRISRSLPLFLCEQLHLLTDAVGIVLQPMLLGHSGGMVLAGGSWEDAFVADQARQCDPLADYAVITHLVTTTAPYRATFRLIRTIDQSILDKATATLDPSVPEACYRFFADRLLALAEQLFQVRRQQTAPAYEVPQGRFFSDYQLRLEQTLVLAASEKNHDEGLSGEREIVGGSLRLCVEQPTNPTCRMVLANVLRRMRLVRPQVVDEYRERVEHLLKQFPLLPPEAKVVDDLLLEAFR